MTSEAHIEITVPEILATLRNAHVDDAAATAILDRIEQEPALWKECPEELRGRAGEVIAWVLSAFHTFRQINQELPTTTDKRTIERWSANSCGPGITPGSVADHLFYVYVMTCNFIPVVMTELAANPGEGWYGEPDVRPTDIFDFAEAIRVHLMKWKVLEARRQAQLKSLPVIGRRNGVSALEQFASRCLSIRIQAVCDSPHDEFVAAIVGIAFGRRNGMTADRIGDRRRRNSPAGFQRKNLATNSR
jgi:hypothetical protein